MFDAKVVSLRNLFLKHLPERLQDEFGIGKLTKSEVCGKTWMVLKHNEYHTDLIFACFFRMPFQDRLRTSIWRLLNGFGIQVGTLWTSILGTLHSIIITPPSLAWGGRFELSRALTGGVLFLGGCPRLAWGGRLELSRASPGWVCFLHLARCLPRW